MAEGAEPAEPAIRAAGGVVWRQGAAGAVEVLLVHRPRYDDWSLPKGKREPGEDDEACAVREVAEETGLRCAVGADLGEVRYRDRHGRPKVVRYWAMTPLDGDAGEAGAFAPHDEVDAVRWVPLDEAAAVLTHERDADVVRRFAGRPH